MLVLPCPRHHHLEVQHHSKLMQFNAESDPRLRVTLNLSRAACRGSVNFQATLHNGSCLGFLLSCACNVLHSPGHRLVTCSGCQFILFSFVLLLIQS
jgi:hypothetical protein